MKVFCFFYLPKNKTRGSQSLPRSMTFDWQAIRKLAYKFSVIVICLGALVAPLVEHVPRVWADLWPFAAFPVFLSLLSSVIP